MTTYRDIILKRQSREAVKQDKLPFKRAVLVNQFGEQTSANLMDDVWASETERRAWYMADGAVQPAQILCRRVSNPYVGLGVIIGYADNSNQIEVLSDDFFLSQSGTSSGWSGTGPQDLEPGGNKLLWVYTKVITPLATYPASGLSVNVIAGDYVYAGVRVTYDGYVGFLLDAPGTPGEHYLAGLYLDNANTLQVVYGTAVVVATDAPEPAWPAGAFRLCAILMENGQTSIDFADDIFDRRLPWTDENSSGSSSAWPAPDKVNIGTTEYATLALAAAAAVAGNLIKVGEGTFDITPGFDFNNTAIDLIGSGIDVATITTSDANGAFYFGPGTFKDVTVETVTADGITVEFVYSSIISDCKFSIVATGTIKAIDIWESCTITDCFMSASGGTNNYGVYIHGSAGTTTIYGGEIVGDVFIDAGSTLQLEGVKWDGARVGAGTLTGWWDDGNGRIKSRYFRHFQLMGA